MITPGRRCKEKQVRRPANYFIPVGGARGLDTMGNLFYALAEACCRSACRVMSSGFYAETDTEHPRHLYI